MDLSYTFQILTAAGTGEAREKLTALAGELVALQASSAAAHLQAMSASQTPVDVTAELVAATAQPASSAAGPVTEEDVDAVLSGTAGNDSSANKTSAARRRGNLRSQLMSINTGGSAGKKIRRRRERLSFLYLRILSPFQSSCRRCGGGCSQQAGSGLGDGAGQALAADELCVTGAEVMGAGFAKVLWAQLSPCCSLSLFVSLPAIAHHQLLYWNENLVDLLHGGLKLACGRWFLRIRAQSAFLILRTREIRGAACFGRAAKSAQCDRCFQ